MKVFLGFQRKPAKSPASAVARAFGMTEQPSDDGNWIFAKNRFRIRLEDLRNDLQPEYREWADQVGWVHNWAVSIAVHHRGRTDIDYIKWHGLVSTIMEAYDLGILWTDSGTDTPQYHMRLDDFIPSLRSEEADDLNPDAEPVETESETESESEPKETSQVPEDKPEIPDSLMDQLRKQVREEYESDSKKEEPDAPEINLVPLTPVSEDEEDEEDFDSFDDWDDEEIEDDEGEEFQEEDIGPITDWD